MYDGDCYPNGSYFGDSTIKPNSLKCSLPNSTLNGGQWIGPNGTVPCDSGKNSNVECTNTSSGSDASLSVYIENDHMTHLQPAGDGWYKCCLPTSCSDPNTNIITANIFSKNAINEIKIYIITIFVEFAQISSFYVDLPTDMTVYPQEYTLHCVKTGYHRYNLKVNIGNTALASYTGCDDTGMNSLCTDSKLLHSSNHTIEHTITVSWDGQTITSESFSQPFTGDQDYQCVVEVTNEPIRRLDVTIQGK